MTKEFEIDNHKLIYHPKRISEWLEKGDCYPIYIEIGLTNACNHRCSFCALDFLKRGRDCINKEIMISSLKEMTKYGVKSVMFAGEGEPLLHKDIGLFTQTAKKEEIDVSITTNGVLFNKEKIEQCLPNLSWIRFSIDSGSPENYLLVHGTNKRDFNRVIANIEESVKFRNKNKLETTIGAQFLTISKNFGEATKLSKILKDIGADNLQIKPYSQHPYSLNKNLYVDSLEYNKLEEELKEFDSEEFKIIFRKSTIKRIEQGITYDKCHGLPFFALIDSKANIFPCNLFYEKNEFIYGNLYKNSFSEIWEGEKRKNILKKIKNNGTNECRKGCRLDSINRYLHRLKNPKPHDNFI